MLGKVVVDGDDSVQIDFLDPNLQNLVAAISIKVSPFYTFFIFYLNVQLLQTMMK